MDLRKVQRPIMRADRRVRIAEAPAGACLAHFVAQLLRDGQMPLVVVDGRHKVTQQCVRVAQTVAGLRLDGALAEIDG